jgi:hypothetical protein
LIGSIQKYIAANCYIVGSNTVMYNKLDTKQMNIKYLPVLYVVLLCSLSSCKKGDQNITGKWQEVKLRMYQVVNGLIKYDTTYYAPFTSFDYIIFNSNGTCVGGEDHYYYPNLPGNPKTAQLIQPITFTFNYTNAGSGYLLTQTPAIINFSGFVLTDTVFRDGPDTLRQQGISYGITIDPNNKQVSESYYVR